MASNLHSRYKHNAQVWYHGHRHRIVEAIGPDVIKWQTHASDCGPTNATNPFGYVTTLTEAGCGESSVAAAATPGFDWLITTDDNEDDGVSVQLNGETFSTDQGQDISFYAKIQLSDATQSDFIIGLGITDTEILGGISDAIYFEKLDGSTSVSFVTEVGSAETQSDTLGTMANATTMELEFYFSDAEDTVYAYIDGVLVATHTAGITATDLTPTIEFEAGAAAAKTMLVRARAFQF